MTSEVSICNQALGWLGQDPIRSFDDNSPQAELCKLNYPELRDTVLSERMWTFATDRAVSNSGTRDAWNQLYVHAVPANWLGVFRVYASVNSYPGVGSGTLRMTAPGQQARWHREGDSVLTDEANVFLWGIKRVEAVTQFSPLFTQALAARIAADLSIALTQNRELQADMWNLYQSKLADAAVRDGQQGRNELISGSLLIAARGTGGA